MPERWLTVPRASTPRRPVSSREVYHPSVQDLSEQAACYGNNYMEETILSVVSTCIPRHSKSSMDHYHDKFYSPTPPLKHSDQEEVIKTSPTPHLCFNKHNNEFHEDLHRQRVLVSAHQRSKIHRIRRSKTAMPRSLSRAGSTKGEDNTQQGPSESDKDEADKFEFIVTNFRKQSVDESEGTKERVNYKLTNRNKPKSAQASLMASGPPLPVLNGYSQELRHAHPKFSQRYCHWLTRGLKVQSFRVNPQRTYAQRSRQPPPLLQYINRPKTTQARNGQKKTYANADFNVVGVQKEVNNIGNISKAFSDTEVTRKENSE